MEFLRPADMELIRRDVSSAVNGSLGTPVVLHWVQESGTANIHGRKTEVAKTQAVRAVISPLSEADVKRLGPATAQEGDCFFLFDGTLDLKTDADSQPRKSLWFEVSGLGSFVPEERSMQAAHMHTVIYPNAQRLMQEIFCKVKR